MLLTVSAESACFHNQISTLSRRQILEPFQSRRTCSDAYQRRFFAGRECDLIEVFRRWSKIPVLRALSFLSHAALYHADATR